MTTKCCQNKAVFVVVYTERTRPRLPLPVRHRHRHRHHFYEHISENHRSTRPRGSGYNRKAQLLDYARHLRASARPNNDRIRATSSNTSLLPSSHLTLASRPAPATPAKTFPPLQIVAAEHKRSAESSPVCCGSWELFSLATLLKNPKGEAKKKSKNSNSSVSTTMKMKHLVKGLRNNGSFMSKMLTAVRKHKNLMMKRFKFNTK